MDHKRRKAGRNKLWRRGEGSRGGSDAKSTTGGSVVEIPMSKLKKHADKIINIVGEYPQTEDIVRNFREIYHKAQHNLENALLPADRPGIHEIKKGAQSKQFMIDMLPHIQRYIRGFPPSTRFDVVDVGCGTGHGANLLASLYLGTELGYRMRVTAVDISPIYHAYISVFCPYIKHVVSDIFKLEKTFDIVICSAVVEHVREPLRFVRRLQDLSRGTVFLYIPYKEDPEILTSGHVNIIDDEFVETLNASRIHYIESPAWGLFFDPRYKMLLAELPGKAGN